MVTGSARSPRSPREQRAAVRRVRLRVVPRLFLALIPPARSLAALRALRRPETPGVRWTDPDTWHVTLRFLGDCDVEDVAAALAGVELPHVTPRLGPTVTLLGPTTVVVPVTGARPVHSAVLAATRSVGRPPDDRRFRGHLTLARLRGGDRPEVLGRRVSGTFDGDAVHLVASTPDADGSDHEVLRSWPTIRRPG